MTMYPQPGHTKRDTQHLVYTHISPFHPHNFSMSILYNNFYMAFFVVDLLNLFFFRANFPQNVFFIQYKAFTIITTKHRFKNICFISSDIFYVADKRMWYEKRIPITHQWHQWWCNLWIKKKLTRTLILNLGQPRTKPPIYHIELNFDNVC